MIGLGLDGYEPDSGHESAIAFRIRVVEAEQYIPAHSHRKGQLILALHGALTCEVENAMWMVPPQYAVWVPGQLSHSNRATPGAQVCFLFIEPGAAPMPDRCCQTCALLSSFRTRSTRRTTQPPISQGYPSRTSSRSGCG